MIGILNSVIRSATRLDAFPGSHEGLRPNRRDVERRRKMDRETLFRARGWGR